MAAGMLFWPASWKEAALAGGEEAGLAGGRLQSRKKVGRSG
jgi:hypothetical protein